MARDRPEATGPALARVHFGGFEALRALAAVMVVAHHAGSYAGEARAGWLATPAAVMDGGVAVFFVLSGFLIYRPFVARDVEGRAAPRLADFWWRRVLRIVPAYWLVLTFFWALGSFELGSQWWRYYLLVQIYSPSTVLGGVVQAWSLATEMSFYLVLPLWAAAVARLGSDRSPAARARWHLGACGVLFAGGYASRVAIEAWWPAQRALSFNWLPTNLDLFASGMALAVVSVWVTADGSSFARLQRAAGRVWPWWTAAAAIFAWYAYAVGPADFATGYSGWFWHRRQLVLALFTVLLMIPAVLGDQERGWARRAWSAGPLVFVGTVSYGLYLWHFDWMKRSIAGVDGFGAPTWPGWVHTPPGDSNVWLLLAVGLGVGLVFAAASWYLLEQPLQRFKDPRRALGRPRPQR